MDKLMRILQGGLISLRCFGLLTGAGAIILRFNRFRKGGTFYWPVAAIFDRFVFFHGDFIRRLPFSGKARG